MHSGLRNDVPGLSTSHLSDEERENLEKMMGKKSDKKSKKPSDSTISSDETQYVSEVQFNEMKEGYRTRIEKLEGKIESQKETIAQLRSEKEQVESRANRLKADNDDLIAKVEAKQKSSLQDADEIAKLKKDNATLKNQLKTAEADAQEVPLKNLAKAKEEITKLSDENTVLSEKVAVLESQIESLRADKDDLSLKLEEAKNNQSKVKVEEPITVGTIRRENPTDFSSQLFTVPKYDVKLAKSGKYMSFEPNIKGNIVCENYRLSIPGLDAYIGYQGIKDYTAIKKGTKLLIYL